ncbi:SGNH/GDSL hydrolase family protein [Nocardia brasiliensis]|uniref:SGNH/GDSL hydrolase family protein n=1 Tax=Nocardia brasiliensis TaxID=37326 RepID=UPI0024566982|nr:SGNH/GDSL hydrolase family protein [Nocardia brasiliensis]
MTIAGEVGELATRVAQQFNGIFTGATYEGDLDGAPFGYASFVDTAVTHDPDIGNGLLLTMKNEDDSARVQIAYSIVGTYAIRYRLGGSWGGWLYFFAGHDTIADIAGLQTALDAKQALPASRTFTLPHSNGGLGGSVATSLSSATAGSDRFVVKLPLNATRWRIKLRNYDYNQTAKTAATLKKLVVGKHSRATTGTALETGSFVSNAATTIVSTDQTIPGNGTWYTSPWVTAAGDVFEDGVEFLVGFGWTISPSTVVQCGAGRSWHWTNSTSGTDPTVAGSGATQTYIPFDWVIEYEVTTRHKVTLVIGDSISEGILGSNSALASTSLWRNPFWLWADRTDRLIVNLSLAGVGLTHFATTPSTNYLWTRQDLSTSNYTIDEVVISAGSNDFSPAGRSLAQMQADTLTIVSHLRTTLGITAPIYLATIIARGSTNDSVRLSWNEWVSQIPTFAADVIDFDGALRGTTAQNLVDQYNPDSIHPSWLGAIAMADKLCQVLP